MAPKRKEWGSKTAWSMSFFDLVPHGAAEEDATRSHTAAPSTSGSGSPSASELLTPTPAPRPHGKVDKARKRLELDPCTRWRCRRCDAVLHPPLDAATRKPRYGLMMTEHLEGVSSGGTTHLATGVAVCTAGPLRFDRPLADARAAAEGRASVASSSSTPRKRAREEAGEGGEAITGQVPASAADPHNAVRRLLRQCQDGARQGCSDAAAAATATAVDVPPLLFIVVENPKTPANAGGILRAMRCYGVHGPAEPSAAAGSGAAEQVRRRVGGFIFSGTRLRKAMAHGDFASTLRTDPTRACREIPQLCVPTLDSLFEVLREEYGHAPPRVAAPTSAPTTPSPSAGGLGSAVRVVAVELVEGAVPLPHYEHPYSRGLQASPGQAQSVTTEASAVIPMVFYVLGAEDGTLSAHHVQQDVDDVVFMPTTGSMNLAATVNVLLYDRLAKECCGVEPARSTMPVESGDDSGGGGGWRDVFESRNANNRIRWSREAA